MNAIKYFVFFRYVPTLSQYYCFSKSKQLPKGAKVVRGRVVTKLNQAYLKETLFRAKISRQKINQQLPLLKFLGSLPWIQYLGISGSASVLNAKEEDDLDLFVITKTNQLWTARFFLIILTSLLGKRRLRQVRNIKNKLCFNLFFSEADLAIPKIKQTEYVAHELLQLKTIVNKNKTWERLLVTNMWAFRFFPLAKTTLLKHHPKLNNYPIVKRVEPFSGLLERLFLHLQWSLIKKHQTTERISKTQLWFFPDDFEKRLAKTS